MSYSIDTVAAIMTTDLVWGSPDSDFRMLGTHPRWGQLDQIPISEKGHLSGVAVREPHSDVFKIRPLSGDMLVSSTTPITELFTVDWTHSPFLFVVQDALVAGVLTPSDLNRQPVFAALFRVIAEFEDRLTTWLDQKPATEDRLACVGVELDRWRNQYDELVAAGFDISPIQVLGIQAKLTLLNQDNPSGNISRAVIKSIGRLRNRVCHQSPLVNSIDDILWTKATLGELKAISRHLELE